MGRAFLEDDSNVTGSGREWLPRKKKYPIGIQKPHRPKGWRGGRSPGWRGRGDDSGMADTFPKHLRKRKGK